MSGEISPMASTKSSQTSSQNLGGFAEPYSGEEGAYSLFCTFGGLNQQNNCIDSSAGG